MHPYTAQAPACSCSTPWLTPALVVSALALLFTVGSFWWIQARRGRLKTFPPRSYAAGFNAHDLLILLPLVLHNTGPAPIVVLDFRLRIDKTTRQFRRTAADVAERERPLLPFYMSWRGTWGQLEPSAGGGAKDMPSPFPVEGRRAVERFVGFGQRSPALLPLDGPYTATVEVLLAHRRNWRPLLSFPLHTERVQPDTRAAFITRSNDPDWMP